MMEVMINRQFNLMRELIQLLCVYISEEDPAILTAEEPGCITTEEIRTMMEQVCGHLDKTDPLLRFFFKGYIQQDKRNQIPFLQCVANVMLESPISPVFEQVTDYRKAMHEGLLSRIRHYEINSYNVGFGLTLHEEYRPLSEELGKLDMPEDFRVALAVALSDYHAHTDLLCDILEPLAVKLEVLLQPWEEKIAPRVRQWQEALDTEEKHEQFIHGINSRFTKRSCLIISLRLFYPMCQRACFSFINGNIDYLTGMGKIPGGFMPDAPSNEDLTAVQLLSNMDRLRILRLLIGRKMLPREITHELNLNRGSVFRDLNNLQQAHLVEQVSQGDKLYYTANIAKANQVLDRLRTFLSE